MTTRSVYWHDGMSFWPHHMQTEERYLAQQVARGQHWNLHHNWGVRSLDVDLDALKASRFSVRGLQGRLHDGTLLDLADTGLLPALDLKPLLAKSPAVMIHVAVPELRLGKHNVALAGANAAPAAAGAEEEAPPELSRFQAAPLEMDDENVSDNAQEIHVRWLNLKLHGGQPQAGYQTLPLARVRRASTPEALPEIDPNYIPPLLACDAWSILQADILQVSYDRVSRKIERLAAEAVTRGITFDTHHTGAVRRLSQLQVLNEASAVLRNLAFVAGVHPFWPYVELCRIVGKLAVFGPSREVPPLPVYNHDDLGGCFWRLKQYLEALLEEVAEPEYQQRPFVGEKLRMQVALEPAWLQPIWQMFVGVRSPLESQECVRLLTRSNQLDMKIGASTRVDEIFNRGEQGLRFMHITQLPQVLPAEPGLVYFQIARESQKEEWQNVEKALALAIRLNQNRIVGDIHDQRVLTIQTGGQPTKMEFTLFLVAEEQN